MSLFGFIGAGNMGFALMKACVKSFGQNQIAYYDLSMEKCSFVKEQLNISAENDNISVVNKCKYLVLAVKPQFLPEVLEEIKEAVSDHIVISIVAGVNIKSIKTILGSATRIVRAMPNTPAMISKGYTGICFSEDNFHDSEKELIYKFFNAFGKYDIFNEKLMNAVTCASGSSPAYVYTFIEALADSVVSLGIPRDKAYTMVSQTILGAAAMVLEGGQHPAHLKDQVCSPAGTTIAGIKALEEFGFRNAIMKATDACYERAVELTEKNKEN
ncbi:pyrroline-5-carboxylate reductase [Herbinix luporum]|uniref:pyrroline-5-carboxylate reductase n=1 Tax=Herbinix luporum TaxID=1679721 RepID=UPI0023F124B1|nr:pyrroline-5-carboxylate reductase [Herbinix luporum]